MQLKTLLRATSLVALAACSSALQAEATQEATVILHSDRPGATISRHIFGQFAEHLGSSIYGGVWVGEDSSIPNVRGIRSDVVQALRDLKVPNVRWPGGCFADQYHWRDGIGPMDQRKTTYNKNWGSPLEPNTFGTHEFMDFVEQIGSEAYITVNVGNGTAREAAEWLEYMTAAQPTALVKERIANGRREPYRVQFLGIGNESWGCGGAISAETYVERMKTYSLFARNLNPEQSGESRFTPGPAPMQRIAVGPGHGDDPAYMAYTEEVMKAANKGSRWSWGIEGLSLHYYTAGEKGSMRDPATDFGEREYAVLVNNTYEMDKLINTHSAVMDKYDPQRKVALVVDEWGSWLAAMPGTSPLDLKQQNSLRDAIVAAINFNIFARHADRVRMANIAQMVNVLQSMILTDGDKMVLTPTYHVFKMYIPFQDAKFVPLDLEVGHYKHGDIELTAVDAIAARDKDGQLWLALTNLDPNRTIDAATKLPGVNAKAATGHVLTADRVDAVNTFDKPAEVVPKAFDAQAKDGALVLQLPPKSVTVVRITE